MTTPAAPRSRDYDLRAGVTITGEPDQGDPFVRAATISAIGRHLQENPVTVLTPYGPVTVAFGLITAAG